MPCKTHSRTRTSSTGRKAGRPKGSGGKAKTKHTKSKTSKAKAHKTKTHHRAHRRSTKVSGKPSQGCSSPAGGARVLAT